MGEECMGGWDEWVEEALAKLDSLKLLRSPRPIHLPPPLSDDLQVLDLLMPWDRSSVAITVSLPTFRLWLHDIPSSDMFRMHSSFPLFSLLPVVLAHSTQVYVYFTTYCSIPPLLSMAASTSLIDTLVLYPHNHKIRLPAHEHGMGPRGSALICGYTNYHRHLESSSAELKAKEDCLLCPTGFAANMALTEAIGNISLLLAVGAHPEKKEKIAVSLNHATIIDGIRLAERQRSIEVVVCKHCNMSHLDELLSSCMMSKKVVVIDSLFSMDGDPLNELVRLGKKHGFLLVIDDAHRPFVCGDNGGGVTELFNCEKDVDICVGTLSKVAGCHGGFIDCSKRWKQLVLSKGRSFIFSTDASVTVIVVGHAAVLVEKKEKWSRRDIWYRAEEFHAITGIPISSPIISLIVGSEEKALRASRHLLESGFHVTAIRPPTVPANSCRLQRIILTATHTRHDLMKLSEAIALCIDLQDISSHCSKASARL